MMRQNHIWDREKMLFIRTHSTNQSVYNVTRAKTNFGTSPEHASAMCSVPSWDLPFCVWRSWAVPSHGFFPNLLSGIAVLVPSFIPQVSLTPVQSATTVPPQQWTIGKALNNPALRLGHLKPGTRRKEKANIDLQ